MADQRIQSTEKMVGAGHATLADTLNRLVLVEHNNDGTHNPALIPLSQKGAANGVASLDAGGTVPDAQIPAAIARDSEVTTAVTNHEAAADPHTGYQKESEKGAASGYASLDAGGTVPDAQIPAAIARDSEVTTAVTNHEAAADPHTGYQKESEKGVASGYASLDAGGTIPDAQIPAAIARDSELSAHTGDGTIHFTKSSINQDDLGDTIITTPSDNDLLAYDTASAKWINQNAAAAALAVASHNHDATYAPIAKGVTNGDSHDHNGGDGAQIDHTTLSNIGTNTHAQIDTHLGASAPHSGHEQTANKGAASGYASLDAAIKVPTAQLGGAGADNTKFLRGDQSWIAFDHGGLAGLADDDHTIYFLASGARNMAGNLQLAGYSLLGNSTASGNLQLNSTSNATKGKILFGANSAFDETNDDIGSGATTSPNSAAAGRGLFTAREGAMSSEANIFQFGMAGLSGGLRLTAARGTKASPSATLSGDGGYVLWGGYGATAYTASRCMIGLKAAENFTDAAQGSIITFETVPIGSITRAEKMRITDVGNIKIAGTANRATTEGTNHLDIFNGTAPVGTLTNGISIYSSAGECYIMDAAGNATLQSPHDKDGRWIFYSKNTRTGKGLKIHMEKLMRKLDGMFGGGFIEEFLT